MRGGGGVCVRGGGGVATTVPKACCQNTQSATAIAATRAELSKRVPAEVRLNTTEPHVSSERTVPYGCVRRQHLHTGDETAERRTNRTKIGWRRNSKSDCDSGTSVATRLGSKSHSGTYQAGTKELQSYRAT